MNRKIDDWKLILNNIPDEKLDELLREIHSESSLNVSDMQNVPAPVLIARHFPPHIANEFLSENVDAYRIFNGSIHDDGPEEFKWARARKAIFSINEIVDKVFATFCFECIRDSNDTLIVSPEDKAILVSNILAPQCLLIAFEPPHKAPHFRVKWEMNNERKVRFIY